MISAIDPRHFTHSPIPFSSSIAGVDHFFVRTAPAKTFDQLGPDFNSVMFVCMLAVAAIATNVVSRITANAELERQWK